MADQLSKSPRMGARRSLAVIFSIVLGAGLALVAQTPAHAASNQNWGSGSTIIGIDYEHIDFGGAWLKRLHGAAGCTGTTGDVDSQGSPMPSGWNDQISSFEAYGGYPLTICLTKHYECTNYDSSCGAVVGWWGTRDWIGTAMNDATSPCNGADT